MYGSALKQSQPTGFPFVRMKSEQFAQRLISLERHCPLMWLALIAHTTGRHIRHAANGSEVTVYGGLTKRPFRADGFAHPLASDNCKGYVYE